MVMTDEDWERLVRRAQLVLPLLSWLTGIMIFVTVTFTDAGTRQPEWYAVVAGLLSLPVATLHGWRIRRKDDEKHGDG